jgi:predicted metal-binding membrane protein
MNASAEALLSRRRLPVALGLGLVCALAWAYTVRLAWQMDMPAGSALHGAPHGAALGAMGSAPGAMGTAMGAGMALAGGPWDAVQLALTFAMWTVMMVAMMLPSAAPMILFFHRIAADRAAKGQPAVPTAVFAGAYLAVWTAFALAATGAQWGLHEAALLSPLLRVSSPLLGGALLAAAGVFQLTPLKHACLARCRTPLGFLLTEWREGARGAWVMGLRHGAFCTGCCWALMALLFVGGVMNLLWVAALAVVVLAEKVLPRGELLGRLGGGLLIAWGAWVALGGPI